MNASEAPKQTVKVTIFNQTYTLSASGASRDTEELAQEVDDLMSSIARRAGNLDSTRTAVLACLHLADRLKSAENELISLRSAVHHRTKNLASLLDEALETSELLGDDHS